MKAILKKPRLIKEVDVMYDHKQRMLQRVAYWRD